MSRAIDGTHNREIGNALRQRGANSRDLVVCRRFARQALPIHGRKRSTSRAHTGRRSRCAASEAPPKFRSVVRTELRGRRLLVLWS